MSIPEDAPVSLLEGLQWVLENSGYETDLIRANEVPEHPFEELLVSYRGEEEPPPLAVRLVFASEVAAGLQTQPPEEEAAFTADMLQILVNLPLVPVPEHDAELEVLLNHFNLSLPQGRFVCPEKEGLLYQDTLPLIRQQVAAGLVAEAIEMSGFLAGRFYPGFARLVLGGETAAEIVSDYPLGGL
jgi:hypothetical protein